MAEDNKDKQSAKKKKASEPKPPKKRAIESDPQRGFREQVRIFRARRELRHDLIARGITDRKDFELIAESMQLIYRKGSPFLIWLHHLFGAAATSFGLKALAALIAIGLIAMFAVSMITEAKGSFTVNYTLDMLRAGFVLSETDTFEKVSSRLVSERMEKVNNITIEDIDSDVDAGEGSHNGNNYIAYSFYIRNDGEKPGTYVWYLRMKSEILNVTDAIWLMLFEDGRQVTYTRAQEDGTPEALWGFYDPIRFTDLAYDDAQYFTRTDPDDNGERYGIVTTPYAAEGIVAQGLMENVEVGEVHKYTVVIWVEGYDPDCTDAIFGGFAKFSMDFDYVEGEPNIEKLFGVDAIYRTAYILPSDKEETDPHDTEGDD